LGGGEFRSGEKYNEHTVAKKGLVRKKKKKKREKKKIATQTGKEQSTVTSGKKHERD